MNSIVFVDRFGSYTTLLRGIETKNDAESKLDHLASALCQIGMEIIKDKNQLHILDEDRIWRFSLGIVTAQV